MRYSKERKKERKKATLHTTSNTEYLAVEGIGMASLPFEALTVDKYMTFFKGIRETSTSCVLEFLS